MSRSSLALASITLLALAPVTPAAPPLGNPPAEAKPSLPESPPIVLNCGTWTCFPFDENEIQLTSGWWIDCMLPPAPWQWRSVKSESPCSVAASIEGRKRWIRKGPFDRSTFPVHPDEQTRIDRMYMHGRALVQAGGGANPNMVWDNNDFYVNAGTDTGGGRREWIAVANYAPPTEGTASGGTVLRVELLMNVKSKIVLDNRIPNCSGVVDGCASATVTTIAEAIFPDIHLFDVYGVEAALIFRQLIRRTAIVRFNTSGFCTGSVTGGSGGSIEVGTTVGASYNNQWQVGGNLYDSGWKPAVLKLDFPFCVVAGTEARQLTVLGVGSIEVASEINKGTWAESQSEVELVKFNIRVENSDCVECSTWREPGLTIGSHGDSGNGGVQ